MQHYPHDIKEKLLRALDKDNNVVDMATVIEVISILEKTQISKDELERTRLGKYVNELRKKTTNEILAKRAKDLVRKWRKLILPSENNVVANGEHHHNSGSSLSNISPIISHLPGPGPGHGPSNRVGIGWGTKPASPAFLNHHHQHHRGIGGGGGGLTETSPGNSQCSSISVSPPATSRSSGGCHSTTGSRLTADGHFPGFQPISPAPNATGGPTTIANKFSLSRPVNNSTSSPATTTISRSSPLAYKSRTLYGSTKRPRTDDDDSCDSHGRWELSSVHHPVNSSLSPPSARFSNGMLDMGDSMDSARSFGESVDECNAMTAAARESSSSSVLGRTSNMTAISSSGAGGGGGGGSSSGGKKGRGPSRRPEKCDMLKEKLASHLKTPKVKTTAELIQELKAKTSGSGVRNSLQGGAAMTAEDRLRVPSTIPVTDNEASLAFTRKVVYSSLLGTDEDITRNKTELMEKFLNESDVRSKEMKKESPIQQIDPVALILTSLPPLNLDEIVWSDAEGEEAEEEENKVVAVDETLREVDDGLVQRLHTDDLECMNGNVDNKGIFRRWNEMLTRDSGSENVLHLLPYVDID